MNLRVDSPQAAVESSTLIPHGYYRRLRWISVSAVASVSVIPLIIMTVINYHQYEEAFRIEATRPVHRLTVSAKLSMESYLSERLSALQLVNRAASIEEMRDSAELAKWLTHIKRSFGGFVDLGLIDAAGKQVSYAGPHELIGRSYQDHDWFHEVSQRGVYVSDVFLGYRDSPHFVIAVIHDTSDGTLYVLRATIDTNAIVRRLASLAGPELNDAFLINREGILQTPSRLFGEVLGQLPFQVAENPEEPGILETKDPDGKPVLVGYAAVSNTPFEVAMINRSGVYHGDWLSLRRELVSFLIVSVLLILGMVFWGATYMINRARNADSRRATLYHKMEYTNKMAAIGRLAAGVAHEINNPLSIIHQNAGLVQDLLSVSGKEPPKEKLLSLIESVLSSVDRCSAITHRLLGFARHMDVETEEIDLELLIRGVLMFLEKEASYRNLRVDVTVDEKVPTIQSDRGQLQQVFLNIINNAFAAVEEGGSIAISVRKLNDQQVAVAITDNGMGIPEQNLAHIFEPFFTTKKGAGTGLGLSITYGIIQKLGGKIEVDSHEGKGTCFTVTLPLERKQS
ncbi:MAG: hypothetical protein A2289_00700 [Deltaproteobacteria bacterium RIFOXYA12_FULL_58_15]|nr:MAG: hypothetical protein A2289_00700 [Deltaproteobacteria bacterium RIFOXYA12_FULL_58_15]OGR08530.1 MAG: hypothetical protein A2341_25285 [Deltaproteobacteria bacterium RIFOXYB12_FULL_58_9]